MDFNQYIIETRRSRSDLNSKDMDNLHMVLGMVTEVAELVDAIKRKIAYNKEVDLVNVKEELGDLFWYQAGLLDINKIDIKEVLSMNIGKLKVRYPEKFTEESATKRDLDKERQILEELGYN